MSISVEKVGILHVHEQHHSLRPDDNRIEVEFAAEEQRRIRCRIDRRLITMVGAMYCVSLIDRTNLGAGAIAGMFEDLVLTGNRFVSRASHLQ